MNITKQIKPISDNGLKYHVIKDFGRNSEGSQNGISYETFDNLKEAQEYINDELNYWIEILDEKDFIIILGNRLDTKQIKDYKLIKDNRND